ncbi:MAG TPA: aminopeptidase P N-terminal domain-containing protein [Blastocatellia bacterium]
MTNGKQATRSSQSVQASGSARNRRQEFMRRITGGAAIFPAATTSIRNGDVEHEYRQDTDFYYLTDFEEPNALAVLIPGDAKHEFVLFVQPREREREVWTGWRAGEEGAVADFGADTAYSITKLDEHIAPLIANADRIYYRFGADPNIDLRVMGLMRSFQRERQRNGKGPKAIIDPAEILHEMRLIKEPGELENLRRAARITEDAHIAAAGALKPGMFEYEIEATLRYVFLKGGSHRSGYPPIVASGRNATVLHYRANSRRIEPGDLILIDAGAEYAYYTADVTRTLPASGRFSAAQKDVYQIVLDAQLSAIDAVKPGASFMEPHDRAVRILTEGMVRLGLLIGSIDELIKEEKFKQFYMHRTSHWLGMDVHDAGPYKVADEWRRLEPGMVLTIEPGLYIAEDSEGVPDKYRGIGVRIEDDVLVTDSSCEVLSARVPKAIEDIESSMATGNADSQSSGAWD